jgi:streptomycin 6-kinase
MNSPVPSLDEGVRGRLTARFGQGVEAWFDELPDVLNVLAERWQVQYGPLIPRGSMSVVIRCRMSDARPAVLKVSPDRTRVTNEAAALERWTTVHTPSVLAVDQSVGALLIEAIEPGIPLIDSSNYPDQESFAELVTSLYTSGVPDPTYPSLAHHVAYLFESGRKPYKRRPELVDVVPPGLYERGRRLAARLAESVSPDGLLHGDLTPSNILEGGEQRGLVAVDPAPCLGDDPAFDAIDVLLWQAARVETVVARAEALAPALGTDAGHLLDWCIACAAMIALELAESSDDHADHVQTYLTLANEAPTAVG